MACEIWRNIFLVGAIVLLIAATAGVFSLPTQQPYKQGTLPDKQEYTDAVFIDLHRLKHVCMRTTQ